MVRFSDKYHRDATRRVWVRLVLHWQLAGFRVESVVPLPPPVSESVQ